MPAPDVIAIDILLEPDVRMLAQAEANNARLRSVFPDGFALDADHKPHITLLQCFIASRYIEALAAAVGAVLRAAKFATIDLQAVRYYYAPGPGVGVAGICAALTPALSALQADVIGAATPFMLATATIDAFTARHDDPAMDAALINYVGGFVAHYAGANYNPHASTGVAPTDYLDAMIAEPFAAFEFAPAGAAIYQLGPYGSAARCIKHWDAI